MNTLDILFLLNILLITPTFCIAVINFLSIKPLRKPLRGKLIEKRISVLIPARNEEKNIEKCVRSLMQQEEIDFEVIVLNDNSTDDTGVILERLKNEFKNLSILQGGVLPEGWLGKNWACQQLGAQAQEDYLLFMDADVFFGNQNTVASAVRLMEQKRVSMFSIYPKQIMKTFGEHLLVPMVLGWLNFFFIPWRISESITRKINNNFIINYFTAACGQFILITKEAYQKIGAHESIKGVIFEDVEMGREVRKIGLHLYTTYSNMVMTRMYSGFGSSMRGFGRGIFPLFKSGPVVYLAGLMILAFAFLFPFVAAFFEPRWIIVIGMIVIGRLLEAVTAHEGTFFSIVFTPLQLLSIFLLGIYSLYLHLSGKVFHKGRMIKS